MHIFNKEIQHPMLNQWTSSPSLTIIYTSWIFKMKDYFQHRIQTTKIINSGTSYSKDMMKYSEILVQSRTNCECKAVASGSLCELFTVTPHVWPIFAKVCICFGRKTEFRQHAKKFKTRLNVCELCLDSWCSRNVHPRTRLEIVKSFF